MAKKIIAPEASKSKQMLELNEVEGSSLDQDTPQHKRALLKAELRKEFITLAEQIAESKIYFRNYKYQGADQLYPSIMNVHQRFVDKCYPYAKCGMLLVDEPMNEKHFKLAKEKHGVLKKKGFKHIIVLMDDLKMSDGTVIPKTTYGECLEQLEG